MDHLETIAEGHNGIATRKDGMTERDVVKERELLRRRNKSDPSISLSKRDSQYKGFNLNLNLSISPENTPTKKLTGRSPGVSATASPSKDDSSTNETVLPSMETLLGMEIDEQLRLLALTEMNIVNVKDNIRKLQEKLQQQEQNVARLRKLIQRSLYRELSSAQNALVKRPSRVAPNEKNKPSQESSNPELQSMIWAKLSNTISMMQQFDNKLLTEFENSLKSEMPRQKQSPPSSNISQRKPSQQPLRQQDLENMVPGSNATLRSRSLAKNPTNRSPLKPFNTHPKSPEKRLVDTPIDTEEIEVNRLSGLDGAEDLLESVQNSIWSFVKTNVFPGYEENLLALVLSRLQDDDDIKKSRKDGGNILARNIEGTPNSVRLDTLTSSIDNLLDVTDDTGDGEDEVTVDLSMYSKMRRR